MSTTIYNSSRGPVEIATMHGPHAARAAAKLRREAPDRIAEIEALEIRAASCAIIAEGEADNPRAVIGGNQPPEPIEEVKLTGREAIEAHVGDLLSEAANWTDGVAIENQDQADSVSRLRRMLQQAGKLIDDTAAAEKKPHNDAIAAIGEWQNGFNAKGLKRTPDGSVTKALALLGRLDTAWLIKLDEERKAREQEAADKAAAAAAEALAAREEAKVTTDAAVVDDAADKLAAARALLKQAEGVAKERVHSGGGEGFRASALRSFWLAKPIGDNGSWTLALRHYLGNEQFAEELRQLIQRYASRDANVEATRVLGIPGFTITEEKRAA